MFYHVLNKEEFADEEKVDKKGVEVIAEQRKRTSSLMGKENILKS